MVKENLVHVQPVNSPENTSVVPLDYASELAFELHMMRGECAAAAASLVEQSPLDAHALEECARLDDALARAQAQIQAAVKNIKMARQKRLDRGI